MACGCGRGIKSLLKTNAGPCGPLEPCVSEIELPCLPCGPRCECREPMPCKTGPCKVPPCTLPPPILPCPSTCQGSSQKPSEISVSPSHRASPSPQLSLRKVTISPKQTPPLSPKKADSPKWSPPKDSETEYWPKTPNSTPIDMQSSPQEQSRSQPQSPVFCPISLCSCINEPDPDRLRGRPERGKPEPPPFCPPSMCTCIDEPPSTESDISLEKPLPPTYCPMQFCACINEPDYERMLCAGPCKTPAPMLGYATVRWNCTSPDMGAIINPNCYKYCERFSSIYQKDFCRCVGDGVRDVCIIPRPRAYDCLPLGKCCGQKFEYLPKGKCGKRQWGTDPQGRSRGGLAACFSKGHSHGIMGPPPPKYFFGRSEYQERHNRLGCMILNYGRRPCMPRVPVGYPCVSSRPITPCGNALPRTHVRPTWLNR